MGSPLVALLVQDGSASVGSKGSPSEVHGLEALLLERPDQRGPDRLDGLGPVGEGRLAGVEHRQQLLDEPGGGPMGLLGACAVTRLR